MIKSYYALILCDSLSDAQDTARLLQAQGLTATAAGHGVQVSRQFTLREEGPKCSPQWEVALMNAIIDEIDAEEKVRSAVKVIGKPYVLLDEVDADSSISLNERLEGLGDREAFANIASVEYLQTRMLDAVDLDDPQSLQEIMQYHAALNVVLSIAKKALIQKLSSEKHSQCDLTSITQRDASEKALT